MVVAPPKPPKNATKTLDARFTMLANKRADAVQRGATARYAATMAKRTGKDAKKFSVSGRRRYGTPLHVFPREATCTIL